MNTNLNLEKLSAYEVIEQRKVSDLNAQGAVLRHKKTGAKITLLKNDDVNKVFYIGFRTPPTDSTGVAHIIEHSVLCGSDKYPVKDPFVELAKGSLNTFLNAMTYPDKTVYPVASCNDKDFANLMDVYLDAVFHPNIYKEPKIFMQEGWHYECESKDAPITINGVVYNEMKGAYSSADDLLDREILNRLYPDTAYGVDSGGKPSDIPNLTYRDFISFHQRYYHPSNSYIYLYGDMDMAEKLEYIDRAYLSHYEYLKIDSTIKKQKAFEKRAVCEKAYPVLSEEECENGYYYSYNVAIKDNLDADRYVALQILDYVLCSAPGTPVKVALFDAGIGEDVYSVCENGIYQPYFSIIAKNCKAEDKERFIEIVENTLKEQVEQGLNKNALKAAISYFEFKYKEADFGAYPKGLMYGLQALDSWLYDDVQPFLHIEANETFSRMKKFAEADYFEKMIQTEILDNAHKATVTLVPEVGLEKEENDALAKKLEAYKASLSKEEVDKIIRQTIQLKEYQESEDKPEDLAKIPMLKREDLKKDAEGFINEEKSFGNTKIIYHPVFTNGVSYLRMIFDIRDIETEKLPYLSLLKNMLCLVGTKNYSYGDLFHEMNIKTGGFGFGVKSYPIFKEEGKFRFVFEVKAKVLYDNTKDAISLLEEILFTSVLDDDKRMKEILGEMKSRMQAQMTSAGHTLAVMRAMSNMSETAKLDDILGGISFYRFVADLLQNFDEKKEACKAQMKEILSWILHTDRVFYDYTGTDEGLAVFERELQPFHQKLAKDNNVGNPFTLIPSKKNEAFCTSAGIQYVCRAGRLGLDADRPYTGALRVMRVMMGYDYLWLNVRVKGGAYGCMSHFSRTGYGYFVSYRDPNLEKTIETYENATAYISSFDVDEDTLTKYVIGAIAEKDTPLNPSAKGERSLSAYMMGLSFEEEQRERDEILNCSNETIQNLAPYVRALLEDKQLCVVGNEEKINDNKALFDQIQPLFS